MFLTENIPALFKKGALKLVPAEDGPGHVRVAEATCLIEPFPHHLARELGEDIASHLFDDDNAIRPELDSIGLRVRAGLQYVTVKAHEELDSLVRLSGVSIKDVEATRKDDKASGRCWLAFSFVLVFSLEDKDARNFVLDNFGRTLLWSFEGMQRDLLNAADLHESISRLVPAGTTLTAQFGDNEPVTLTEEDAKAHRKRAKELRQQAKVN